MANPYASVGDLVAAVQKAGGLKTVRLGDLPPTLGRANLTAPTRRKVAAELEDSNLGFFPLDLLDPGMRSKVYPEDVVRVYDREALAGQIVNAVLQPSPAGDKVLQQVTNENYPQMIAKIRELVGV